MMNKTIDELQENGSVVLEDERKNARQAPSAIDMRTAICGKLSMNEESEFPSSQMPPQRRFKTGNPSAFYL